MWSDLETHLGGANTIDIPTDSLFSKFGFLDGDLIPAFCEGEPWYDEAPWAAMPDKHDILMQVVRTLILPHIEEEIVLEKWTTCHNACRAASVCGISCEELEGIGEYPPELHPSTVRVSIEAIQGLAKATFLESHLEWFSNRSGANVMEAGPRASEKQTV